MTEYTEAELNDLRSRAHPQPPDHVVILTSPPTPLSPEDARHFKTVWQRDDWLKCNGWAVLEPLVPASELRQMPREQLPEMVAWTAARKAAMWPKNAEEEARLVAAEQNARRLWYRTQEARHEKLAREGLMPPEPKPSELTKASLLGRIESKAAAKERYKESHRDEIREANRLAKQKQREGERKQ